MKSSLIFIVIGMSLSMILLGVLITVRSSWQRRFFSLPLLLQKLYVLCFMAPVVVLPFISQQRYEEGWLISSLCGGVLVGAAALIWFLSLWQMRGIPSVREASGLVTGGIYGLVRNPLYLGNFLILVGLGLVTQSIVALLYAPFWFVGLALLSFLEERGLHQAYQKEYQRYCEIVPYRLLPYLF